MYVLDFVGVFYGYLQDCPGLFSVDSPGLGVFSFVFSGLRGYFPKPVQMGRFVGRVVYICVSLQICA